MLIKQLIWTGAFRHFWAGQCQQWGAQIIRYSNIFAKCNRIYQIKWCNEFDGRTFSPSQTLWPILTMVLLVLQVRSSSSHPFRPFHFPLRFEVACWSLAEFLSRKLETSLWRLHVRTKWETKRKKRVISRPPPSNRGASGLLGVVLIVPLVTLMKGRSLSSRVSHYKGASNPPHSRGWLASTKS